MRAARFYLVVFDATTDPPAVEDVGTESDVALARLRAKERELAGTDRRVVMLGAESIDALKRSHSSYFGTSTVPIIPTA